ncbi:MAG TPA: DUF1385 domain-containing protein [Polyangiaceae bacterium]
MSNQPAVLGPDGVARPYIGGQALIEGVMMRSPHCFSAVVRRKNGTLVVREQPMSDLRRGKLAWPLVRGVAALVEALKLGSAALRFSAEQFEQDLDHEDGAEKAPRTGPSTLALISLPILALISNAPEDLGAGPKPIGGDGEPKKRFLGVLSVVFAIGVFVALPQAFAAGASSLLGFNLDVRDVRFQLLTAAAKLTILIGYMLLIRRLPEIYRVFQYHGAEHKSIFTYEAGEALTVENARPKTTLHPRCGTTFIVMVALVSIFVFSALGPLLPHLGAGKLADNLLFFAFKLPFLPFIAALTFELQRLLAKYATRGPLQVLLWPGFLVQKITTIQPDDRQLEVALSALLVTLEREQQGVAPEFTSERTFDDFTTLTRGAVPAT